MSASYYSFGDGDGGPAAVGGAAVGVAAPDAHLLLGRLAQARRVGQQQRLGLCRALMLEPDLLLLDEPFSAVDPVTRLGLYEVFEEVQRGQAISTLLVTHDMREARRLADVLVVLEHGQIIQSGSPDDVFAAPASPYVERLIASVA